MQELQNKIIGQGNNIALTKGVIPDPRKRQFIRKGILGIIAGIGIAVFSKITGATQNVIWADSTSQSSSAAITALNSATADELVTVGATTTELDAETNLTFDGTGQFAFVNSASGSSSDFKIYSSATSGSTPARLILRTGDGNTADTWVSFHGQEAYEYSVGVDNSDDDKFKISGSALGTNDKLTIQSDGHVGIGTTSIPADTLFKLEFSSQSWVANFANAHSSGSNHVMQMNFQAAAPDGANNLFLYAADNSAVRFKILSDGDMLNHDGTFSSISDERIKQGIGDATSQWEDVKAISVRNFKKNDDVRQYGEKAWEQIGVIAQEVELVSPKLIKNNPPDDVDMQYNGFGTQNAEGKWIPNKDENGNDVTVKSMKYSVLHMKAFKALQEAMTRIEILEAEVAALKE